MKRTNTKAMEERAAADYWTREDSKVLTHLMFSLTLRKKKFQAGAMRALILNTIIQWMRK